MDGLEEAVENYKHSVLLNPKSPTGLAALKEFGIPIEDVIIKLPLEQVEILQGDYTSESTDKIVTYSVLDGKLTRTYKDRDATINLTPIGNNQFLYQERDVHVSFNPGDSESVVLTVVGKRSYKKVTGLNGNVEVGTIEDSHYLLRSQMGDSLYQAMQGRIVKSADRLIKTEEEAIESGKSVFSKKLPNDLDARRYLAHYINGYWIVKGLLPAGFMGGTLVTVIDSKSGEPAHTQVWK